MYITDPADASSRDHGGAQLANIADMFVTPLAIVPYKHTPRGYNRKVAHTPPVIHLPAKVASLSFSKLQPGDAVVIIASVGNLALAGDPAVIEDTLRVVSKTIRILPTALMVGDTVCYANVTANGLPCTHKYTITAIDANLRATVRNEQTGVSEGKQFDKYSLVRLTVIRVKG